MRVLLLAALVGCGFSPSGEAVPDGRSGGTGDAESIDSLLLGVDAAPADASGPPCYATDSTDLVLCLELDDPDLTGSGTAKDGSSKRHDAQVTDGDPIMRDIPASSPAQLISTVEGAPQATIETADSPDFYLQKFTLLAWVAPSATPEVGNSYGLIEKADQFVMDIDSDGNLECLVEAPDQTVDGAVGAAVTVGAWTLAGCTFDGSAACAVVEPGGTGSGDSECQPVAITTLNTSAEHGVVIGARYDPSDGIFNHLYGSIDSARIYDTALTAQQICVEGGRSGC